MVKMSDKSRAFLQKHLPQTLSCEWVNDVLIPLDDLICTKGFALPHYQEYNDFGREAQRVYDDIFMSNHKEK